MPVSSSLLLIGAALAPVISGHILFPWAVGDRSLATDNAITRPFGWRPEAARDHGYQFSSHWDVTVFSSSIAPWQKPVCTNDNCCKTDSCWAAGYYVPPERKYVSRGCGVTIHNMVQYYETTTPCKKYFECSPADYSPESQQKSWDRNVRFYQQTAQDPMLMDVPWETWQKAQNNLLTQCTAGGYLRLNVHMVNDDGAGPYRCKLDMSATGTRDGDWDGWLNINQTGVMYEDPLVFETRGRGTRAINQPFNSFMYAEMPKNLDCKGETLNGQIKNLCLLRCENTAASGPFGSCLIFQQYKPPQPTYKPPPKSEEPPAPQPTETRTKDPTEPSPATEPPSGMPDAPTDTPPVLGSDVRFTVTTTKTGDKPGTVTKTGEKTDTIIVTIKKVNQPTVTRTTGGPKAGTTTLFVTDVNGNKILTSGTVSIVITTKVKKANQPTVTTTVGGPKVGTTTIFVTNDDGETVSDSGTVSVVITTKNGSGPAQKTVTRTTEGPKPGTTTRFVTDKNGSTIKTAGTVSVIVTTVKEDEGDNSYDDPNYKKRSVEEEEAPKLRFNRV